jgi:hypothetical protein
MPMTLPKTSQRAPHGTADGPDVIFELKHPVAVLEAILATCRAHPAADKGAAASSAPDLPLLRQGVPG